MGDYWEAEEGDSGFKIPLQRDHRNRRSRLKKNRRPPFRETPAGEFRFAFFCECGEAFFAVGGLQALDVGGGVSEEGGFGLGAFILMDEAFGFAQRDGRRC